MMMEKEEKQQQQQVNGDDEVVTKTHTPYETYTARFLGVQYATISCKRNEKKIGFDIFFWKFSFLHLSLFGLMLFCF